MTEVHDISDGETSSSLLVRVKADDPQAWQRMVHLYSPLVYEWCRRAKLQAVDAADVGQEVFQVVAAKIYEFRRDQPGDTFRGWLRSITRFKILSLLRSRSEETGALGGSDAHRSLHQLPDANPTFELLPQEDEEQFAPSERVLLCRRALELIRSEFEQKTWNAFWQVTIEDKRPADVAETLGMSVNSVYLAKSRILNRLRVEFEDLLEFDLE